MRPPSLAGQSSFRLGEFMRFAIFFLSAAALGSAACDQPSRPEPVASVSLSPDTAFVMLTKRAQLTAMARTSAGAAVSGVAFTWTSSDSTVATVSATGQVVARQRGHATISAFAGGVGGSATVQVIGASGIRVLSGGESQDTIDAILPELLLVEVRDAGGQPVSGSLVAFSGERPQRGRPITVEQPEGGGFKDTVLVSTDPGGRAAVRVRLGTGSGGAGVVVAVHGQTAMDTVPYTVLPGAPARAEIVPRDTAVSPGGTVALRGSVLDRHGNPTPATLEFQVEKGPGAVHAQTGVVTTAGFGTTVVVGRMGEITDAVRVSAVPGGTLAIADISSGLYLVNVDGTGGRVVSGWGGSRNPAWSPDGKRVVFMYSKGDPGLFSTTRLGPPAPLPDTKDARNPRYSRDGQWLYFLSGAVEGTLGRIRPDGTGRERLTTAEASFQGRFSLSPDGRRIAHHVIAGQDTFIHVTDLVTGQRSEPLAHGRDPDWSPVSDLILFKPTIPSEAPRLPRWSLAVIRDDGTGWRGILPSDQRLFFAPPRWSPDGRWIAGANGSTVLLIEVETGLLIRAGHLKNSLVSEIDWGPALPPP
ncbi:Ig-like domain-containing protein [Longimicrobium sp.]|jgi:hypothetical protein|uniref:Ig-like domain-containing protein n=1 Tax=Longimicrobium sp. TaxID=2029185 RepID=UPI002F93319B